MGYYAKCRDTTAIIRSKNFAAFRSILAQNGDVFPYTVGLAEFEEIHKLIERCGWGYCSYDDGWLLSFSGRWLSGASMRFPELIAGIVESINPGEDAYVELEGNCGDTTSDLFRVCFEDGEAVKRNATITFA